MPQPFDLLFPPPPWLRNLTRPQGVQVDRRATFGEKWPLPGLDVHLKAMVCEPAVLADSVNEKRVSVPLQYESY